MNRACSPATEHLLIALWRSATLLEHRCSIRAVQARRPGQQNRSKTARTNSGRKSLEEVVTQLAKVQTWSLMLGNWNNDHRTCVKPRRMTRPAKPRLLSKLPTCSRDQTNLDSSSSICVTNVQIKCRCDLGQEHVKIQDDVTSKTVSPQQLPDFCR